jgi:hypothetical protein
MKNLAISALAAGLAASFGLPAQAEMMHHKSKFTVRYGSITVGEATFNIDYDATTYTVDARGNTAGIVDVFAPGKGKAKSDGVIEPTKVIAQKHFVEYEEPEKTSALEVAFTGGDVAGVKVIAGKLRTKKSKRWVQIQPDQLKAVIDPASSLVIPVKPEAVGDGRAVCDRVFNVYDGDTRYDIALTYKSSREIAVEGYKGNAFVCQLRYIPVAGHRRNEKNIEYMASNKDMEVWLAPMAGSSLFTPIRFDVPTWVGTVIAYPTYFGNGGD